ncbi:Conserved_hypothetical protein [Hexamita inflata]|uniref:Uncharacterized protein n=1 Tax=Hexamita inflata TaxID=28002 RepID=A0ABP1GG90_9EUKA
MQQNMGIVEQLIHDGRILKCLFLSQDEKLYQQYVCQQLFPALNLQTLPCKSEPVVPQLESLARTLKQQNPQTNKSQYSTNTDTQQIKLQLTRLRKLCQQINASKSLTTQQIQMKNVEHVSENLMKLMDNCGQLLCKIQEKTEQLKVQNQLGAFVGKLQIKPLERL